MRIGIQSGVTTAAIGIAGGGAIMIAPAQTWIGYSILAVAALVFLWGIKIDNRHWWSRKRPLTPEREDTHPSAPHVIVGEVGEFRATENDVTSERTFVSIQKADKIEIDRNRLGERSDGKEP